jgi:hypothetical protein
MLAHDPWLGMRGPWAESGGFDPMSRVPTGFRRKALALLGTGINLVSFGQLVWIVFTRSPVARRLGSR